jgi:hypothetical protein
MTNNEYKTTYSVIDNANGNKIGTYKTRQAAQKRADKLDNQYGAIRYEVRINWAN